MKMYELQLCFFDNRNASSMDFSKAVLSLSLTAIPRAQKKKTYIGTSLLIELLIENPYVHHGYLLAARYMFITGSLYAVLKL